MPDFLTRKKKLLKKREHLLVEIGLDILKNNLLPEGYENLPRDTHRADRMIDEGQKHLDVFEAKWQVYRDEGSELRKEQKALLQEEQPVTEPLLASTSNHPESQSKQPDQEKDQLNQELEKRLEENEKQLRHFQMEIDQTRANLDLLQETKRARLRDLAFDYHTKNKRDSQYATKFSHYTLIQLELQELCAQTKPQKGLHQIPDERRSYRWLWIPSFFLIFLAILLIFRNEFTTQQVSFSAIAKTLPLIQGENRFLIDWDTAPESIRKEILENTPLVQGVSLLDLDPSTLSGVKRVLFSQGADQSLAFMAIELKTPIHHLEEGFLVEGWSRQKNEWAVEAFSKNGWVWYHLNQTQFLYYPEGKSLFLHEETPAQDLDIFLHTTLPVFDTSHPLIEGYSLLHLEKTPVSFEWTLNREDTPIDFTLRKRFLQEMQERSNSPFKLHFKGNQLHASGPASLLIGWKSPEDCVLRVCQTLEKLKKVPRQQPPGELMFESKEGDLNVSNIKPRGSQVILRLSLHGHTFQVAGSAWVGDDISDLFYSKQKDELWVLDRGIRAVTVFSTKNDSFILKENMSLPQGFTPASMMQNPTGSKSVLFGGKAGKQPVRFGIMKLTSPNQHSSKHPLQLTTVPSHIDEITSAAWDEQSNSLFLGVSSRGKRGRRSHGLLTYGLESGEPSLKQLIDFPQGKSGVVSLSSLIYNPTKQLLYALNQYQNVLHYFYVDNGIIGQKNGVFISERTPVSLQKNPVIHSNPFLMSLSRNATTLALVDLTDYSGKNFGNTCILLDLESSPPISTSQVELYTHLHSIHGVPLSNHYIVLGGNPSRLSLLHEEQGFIKRDSSISFAKLHPKCLTVSPLGEAVYVAATLMSTSNQGKNEHK